MPLPFLLIAQERNELKVKSLYAIYTYFCYIHMYIYIYIHIYIYIYVCLLRGFLGNSNSLLFRQ